MTMLRLLRGEIRKLTTTKLPWGFLAVLVVVAGLDAAVVAFGTDMDGSKAFVATAATKRLHAGSVSGQTRSRCPAGCSQWRLPTVLGVALIWTAARRTP